MTLTVTTIGNNADQPSISAYSYVPDQLIAGPHNPVTQPIVLGAGTLQRGTVLGQQTGFTVSAAAVAGNTGNGTIGSITPGNAVEYSVATSYLIKATAPTQFSVTDPAGVLVGTATVGVAFASGELNFTITAGGTAFVAGDSFTVTFTYGDGTFVQCVKTATDGSQVPCAILVDNADASGGPVSTGAYFAGEFNGNALTFDASWTLTTLTAALRASAIFVKFSVSATDPT